MVQAAHGAKTATAVLHVAVTVVVLVVGFTIVGFLGYLTAGPTGSVTTYVVIQSVLGLLVVALVVRWRAVVGLRAGLPAVVWTGGPAVAAYLLQPFSWGGATFFFWRLLDPGVITWFLDLAVWVGAVWFALTWARAQQDLETGPATPYG